jgi:hypothetical protein
MKTRKAPAKAKTMKARVQNASHSMQETVAKAETATLGAMERVEDTFESMKEGFENAKQVGTEVLSVVDNAGRTTFGGMVTINRSLMDYSKEALNDTMEVGKKTFEAKSFADVVELQTAFTERRIAAAFHTMGAINTLAQHNVMAVWGPFAEMVREKSAQSTDLMPKMDMKSFMGRTGKAA